MDRDVIETGETQEQADWPAGVYLVVLLAVLALLAVFAFVAVPEWFHSEHLFHAAGV